MSKRLLLLLPILLFAIGSCSHRPTVVKTCRIIAEEEQSVFAQTKAHFPVEYDSSGAGVFIKGIDGVAQTRSTYWLYFINGKGGQVSCEECIPSAGDTIEWRLISGY